MVTSIYANGTEARDAGTARGPTRNACTMTDNLSNVKNGNNTYAIWVKLGGQVT